jgi:hypothetical protein
MRRCSWALVDMGGGEAEGRGVEKEREVSVKQGSSSTPPRSGWDRLV